MSIKKSQAKFTENIGLPVIYGLAGFVRFVKFTEKTGLPVI